MIKKARKGDGEAFTRLMQAHMQDMYKTAWAILRNDEDAADAVSDTILACWEKLYQLKQDRYFKTWMIRILINNCNAILQKDGKAGVFVYTPSDNKVSRREVTIVRLMSDGRCIITSDELKPGELVVSAGIHHIQNGETVKPLPAASKTNIGGLL